MDEMEISEENHHMVVNFSNNDIHVQPLRKSDKPDHLIDLFGHVTGLCLSRDSRQVVVSKLKVLSVKNILRCDPSIIYNYHNIQYNWLTVTSVSMLMFMITLQVFIS